MPSLVPNISALVQDLTRQIIAVTESVVAERAQVALSAALGGSAGRGPGRGKQARALAAAPARGKPGRRAPKATAKLARARKLQGQYLGALRSLGQAHRVKVRALAKAKGVAAALQLVASLKKPKR